MGIFFPILIITSMIKDRSIHRHTDELRDKFSKLLNTVALSSTKLREALKTEEGKKNLSLVLLTQINIDKFLKAFEKLKNEMPKNNEYFLELKKLQGELLKLSVNIDSLIYTSGDYAGQIKGHLVEIGFSKNVEVTVTIKGESYRFTPGSDPIEKLLVPFVNAGSSLHEICSQLSEAYMKVASGDYSQNRFI